MTKTRPFILHAQIVEQWPSFPKKMDWLERALKAKEGSLEYAIARDQLIKRHVLPDDEIVESNDDYWDQFKASKN